MARQQQGPEGLSIEADVLVLGGGPAGAWAALEAARAGGRVVLADKGYFGTSGATAPSNTGAWCLPPGEARRQAIDKRAPRTLGLANSRRVHEVLDRAYCGLQHLATVGYPFPLDDGGTLYIANLRGPDYMRFMRRAVLKLGVTVLDHHPALELLTNRDGYVGGAAGIGRQEAGWPAWRVVAPAVVLATGGCAFGERILGATGLSGDGYLMAAEVGASLSGMEFSAQYGIAPAGTSLNKGLIYRWATFSDASGRELDGGGDRQVTLAAALLQGPVFARLDKAAPDIQDWLRRGQPNCFLPFDRAGIDPFADRFAITLRSEGTVRGVGGIRLVSHDGATGVPGLYAAGDAASREDLNGAISGGGGPNAAWAIASGAFSGRAAAAHAGRSGRGMAHGLRAMGQAGLRPRSPGPSRISPAEAVAAVRAAMLPLEHNFFRTEAGLQRSRARLDDAWTSLRDGSAADDVGSTLLRSREAAALVATSRWVQAAAVLRTESRGLHRRRDRPALDPGQAHRIVVAGTDQVDATFERMGSEAAAS